MELATQEFLSRLRDADLFSAVGEAKGPAVVVVRSWKKAAQTALAMSEDFDNEARNHLSLSIPFDRHEEWNDRVGPLGSKVDQILAEKLSSPTVRVRLEPLFEFVKPEPLQWYMSFQLSMAGMEAEYFDVIAPGYFTELANWYIRGHFPCGWRGDFPDGKLIVF